MRVRITGTGCLFQFPYCDNVLPMNLPGIRHLILDMFNPYWPLCSYMYSTQTTNPPNHQESINVRIRGELRIFQPICDALRFSYETGKKQLRIFAGFGWIRHESPRHCAEFATMYNNLFGNTAIS